MSIQELLSDLPPAGDAIEAAARRLAEAVKTHPGRRPVSSWRKTVGPWLGKKRLRQALYQQVIDRGVSLGLFQVEDQGNRSYFVVAVATPELIPEPAPEPVKEPEPEPTPEPEKPPQKKGKPTRYMKCGHLSCHAADDSPATCKSCEKGVFGHPFFTRGEFIQPVPERLRRSPEREGGMGWPGYCTSQKSGLYIGGVGNDCRFLSDGNRRQRDFCVIHDPKKAR